MFQGLSTALTSLYATRQALETTGNNIANAQTEGYTRQRVELSSIGTNVTPSYWSTGAKSGVGVSIDDIARLRDQFLESRGIQEHANQGELERMKSTYQTVELAFGEPGDSGLQSQLAQFWATWDDVANRPEDAAARSQVIEQAQTLVSVFSESASSLAKLKTSSVETLKSDISSINAMARNIADLNVAIKSAVNAGVSPNELLDKRDLLIHKMSSLASITVQPTEAGSVAIVIGGVAIVRDKTVNQLEVDDSGTPITLKWDVDGDPLTTTNGYAANVVGGDIGGILKSVNTIIPNYLAKLDSVASALITTVNTQHALGIDQAGNPGGVFFTGTTATNIGVDSTLAADSSLLAAGAAGGGELDGENARLMAAFASAQTGPDAEYRQMIDLLGVEAQRSYNQLNVQTNITNAIDAAREAASGVNLDEEMANLIKFQKSYNASARYLTIMDNVLDSLINIVR